MAISIREARRIGTAATLVLSSASIGALGCNAILGIDEGHLVSGDASAGGSPSGSGGSIPDSGGTSGSGGAATGGSGGAPSGGSGAGGNGTGGKATGGAAGAGGGGGAGGIPAGVANEVHCGTESCKLSQGQVCCVSITNGDAHCSTACDPTTQAKFSCDGAEDCPNRKCCYPAGQTTATCAATCQGRVFCNADADCAPGQFCTPGSTPLATVSICSNAPPAHTVWCAGASCDLSGGKVCCYNKTTKTESCTSTCGANDVRFECDGSNDCASGSVCCPTLTGLGLFTGSQCTAGSCQTGTVEIQCGGANGCMSGEICCAQSTGSACAAMCSTGTLCGTDADCASTAMQCTVVTATAIGQPTGSSHCASPP